MLPLTTPSKKISEYHHPSNKKSEKSAIKPSKNPPPPLGFPSVPFNHPTTPSKKISEYHHPSNKKISLNHFKSATRPPGSAFLIPHLSKKIRPLSVQPVQSVFLLTQISLFLAQSTSKNENPIYRSDEGPELLEYSQA
ncbi:MAG: hypothetical protein IPL12_10305 [Bacteroidetes bacterium]|nr:hypothetical protein [Bacteroidota bacterium]